MDATFMDQLPHSDKGIDVSKLEPGTVILVKTRNSNYEITIQKNGLVLLKGGQHLPEAKQARFNGSTWGGTCLKVDWIGHEMYMEFLMEKRILTTTKVLEATVKGDGWEYKMDW